MWNDYFSGPNKITMQNSVESPNMTFSLCLDFRQYLKEEKIGFKHCIFLEFALSNVSTLDFAQEMRFQATRNI